MSLQNDASRGITQGWGFCMPPGENEFTKCYIVLDKPKQLLICYKHFENRVPDQEYVGTQQNWPVLIQFNTDSISLVEEARKSKRKYCFAVHSLAKITYFCAESWRDMEEWVVSIKNSCRISVDKSHLNPNRVSMVGSYRTDIVGGKVIQTPVLDNIEETSVDNSRSINPKSPNSQEASPLSKQVVYKTGYCVKQGAKMKSWKRRYLCLTESDLTYYKHQFASKPLRSISLADVKDVKVSNSEMASLRSNLIDLATSYRTFYLQFDSVEEMHSWIEEVRRAVGLSSSTYL